MIPESITSILYDENWLKDLSGCEKLSGGMIHSVVKIAAPSGDMVLKFSRGPQGDALRSEASGLNTLKQTSFLVPEVFRVGQVEDYQFLLMEYLPMGQLSGAESESFAEKLTEMHAITAQTFGFKEHNHIGSTRQINTKTDDWTEFFIRHRLGFQFELLKQNLPDTRITGLKDQLLDKVLQRLEGHQPKISLLHGDLWSGNAALSGKQPVIYDPAVYYGDRETDLAMMKLFGGFNDKIFTIYQKLMPLPEGSEWRIGLYQLYHLLNHMNLFGYSYEGQTHRMMQFLINY